MGFALLDFSHKWNLASLEKDDEGRQYVSIYDVSRAFVYLNICNVCLVMLHVYCSHCMTFIPRAWGILFSVVCVSSCLSVHLCRSAMHCVAFRAANSYSFSRTDTKLRAYKMP